MRLFSSLATLSLSLLSISTPVVAQQQALRGRDLAREQNSGEVHRPNLRRNGQKGMDGIAERPELRETAAIQSAEELKPISEQGLLPRQASERLSPEERRQLRRDINAAGRDIYRHHKSP